MSLKVKTSQGVVIGVESEVVVSFKGIPYAAPPVGDLRFAPPAAPLVWSGERDCSVIGPISLQPMDPLSELIPGCEQNYYDPKAVQDEDCLNLNIWTPDATATLPVMFWIHGGGWITGSGSAPWTDGTAFANNHNVVVVSINYRLGALGYLVIDDPESETGLSANSGLLDQIAALHWVQENIAAFGGDASRLCIFGESAGAISVVALLGTPRAQGLFSRAIVQSGHHDVLRSLESARQVSEAFLARLGILQGDPLSQLRKLNATALLAAQTELAADIQLPFTMVVDGNVLPVHPLQAIAHGSATSVPMMIGTNSDENRLFRVLNIGPGVLAGTFSDRLESLFLSERLSPDQRALLIKELLALYSATRDDEDTVEEEMGDDRIWRAAVHELSMAHRDAGGAVFSYEFDFKSPVRELGACHALEIPFVFRNLHSDGVNEFVGEELSDDSLAGKISIEMHNAWAAFARGGTLAVGSEEWSRRSAGSEEQMYFAADTRRRTDPHVEKLLWWNRNQDVIVSRLVH